MTWKSDSKFQEKLTDGSKYDMRNLVNFSPTTQKVQKFYLDGLFLLKVCEVWAKKIQRSYLSWQCIVIQNLDKP